jgi:hypothetical protein
MQPANIPETVELERIYQWINELCNPLTRENALIELRFEKKTKNFSH